MKEKDLLSGQDMLKIVQDLIPTTDSRIVFMKRARKLIIRHCPTEHESAMIGVATRVAANAYGNNLRQWMQRQALLRSGSGRQR